MNISPPPPIQQGRSQWTTPTLHRCSTSATATAAIQDLLSHKPAVVAMGVRSAHVEDAAAGPPPLAVVCVVALLEGEPHAWLFEDAALTSLEELQTAWSGSDGPYVVFGHAQAELRGMAARSWEPPRVGCVMTAQILLAAEGGPRFRGRGWLEQLAAELLDVELLSPMCTEFDALAREASVSLELMRRMTPQLRRAGLVPTFEMECSLLPSVLDMERRGIRFDREAFTVLVRGWQEAHDELTLADAEDAPPRLRRLKKLLSTYAHWGDTFVGDDGRIRCHLHPMTTDSGRFSCTDPNLQQVPSTHTAPGFRACFRASPGHRLIVADYAQVELRVAAQVAPCDAMRRVFVEGRDPHRTTAATLTGKSEHDITDRERKLAKAINFGFLFGMGPRRFQSYAEASYGLELDPAQAREARDAFLRTYPGVHAWHQRTAALPRDTNDERVHVATRLGRRRGFDIADFSFTTALNIPVQGTAAEGFKLAMMRLHTRLPALEARGLLCVHDEYIAEAPAAHAEQVRERVVEEMTAGMRAVTPDVPIEVEATVCDNWEEA